MSEAELQAPAHRCSQSIPGTAAKDAASARGHGAGARQRRALQTPPIRQSGWQAGRGQGQPRGTSGCPGGTLPSSLQCAGLQLGRVPGGGTVPGPWWLLAGRGRSWGGSQHLQEALAGRGGVTASAPSFKDAHLA